MIARVRAWLAARSEREQRLLVAAAVATLATAGGGLALAVIEDVTALRARVAAHERELVAVRRLAAAVARPAPSGGDDALMTRVQAATDASGLAERVAAMTPADGPGGARLAVRLGGTSLAETVRLLHALDAAGASLGVARLGLRKRGDDPRRFDVTLEIAGP